MITYIINYPLRFVKPIISCYSESWKFCCMVNQLKHLFILASRDIGIKRVIKFCLVGLSGAGVNFFIFLFITRVAGLNDLVALILSWEVSVLSNFTLNNNWTFQDRRTGSILTRIGKFHMVSIGVVLLYYAIYTPLTRLLEVYDLIAYLIAIGAGVVWNFTVNVFWTWRRSGVQEGSF